MIYYMLRFDATWYILILFDIVDSKIDERDRWLPLSVCLFGISMEMSKCGHAMEIRLMNNYEISFYLINNH
jgi:hypothetical protein